MLGHSRRKAIGYLFAVAAFDLNGAYQSALDKTETVAIQTASQEQLGEQATQATGALFPSIAFTGTYLRQDQSAPSGSSTTQAFTRPDQISARIGATQPLFQGLAEYATLRSTRDLHEAGIKNTEQSKLTLYGTVAEAYFNVLSAERDLQNLKRLQELTNKREKDLTQRNRIGKSRKGEVLSAQSIGATLKAQIQAAEALLSQSRDQFAYVTGLDRNTALKDDVLKLPEKLESLDQYVGLVGKRPDLEALRLQVSSAEENIIVARAGHFPTLEASGNYYLKRTGVLENVKWDFGLSVTFPIFQGGVVSSQVREAAQAARSSELTLSQSERNARREVQVLYEGVSSGIAQISSYQQALKTSEQNYEEQIRDYRYGLVTNLEVLQSMTAFLDTKRLLDRTLYQTLISYAQLQAAVGRKPSS